MKASWLNIFFHFSGKIFKLKQGLIASTRWYVAVYYALLLFFVELALAIISFPLYFLVSPKDIQKGGLYSLPGPQASINEYLWRRRIGLTTGVGATSVFLLKVVLVGVVSFYFLGAQKLLADSQDWTFGTPSDYTYNSSIVEITGGVARLKDLGSLVASSTINSGFTTNSVGWTNADWTDPGNVTVGQTRQTSGGNTGAYVDVDIAITGSATANRSGAGYWQQTFITNVATPDTATLNLDWKSITYTSPTPPATYRLYAFIETTSGAPTATNTAIWNSGEITAATSWASISAVDIVSKIPTAGTYYLKIAAYATSPLATGAYSFISGFDNVIVNWSKTTHSYSTANPTTTPVASLSAPKIMSWNGFTENATLNGGSISYQLTADNGTNWKYWNGSAWATSSVSNFNIASVINSNIATFPTSSNQIKWRAYMTSDGTQQVSLSGVSITYTQNDPPHIISLSPAQNTGNGTVYVAYSLQDANSDPESLVDYEYSLTGAFAGEQTTMTASTSDAAHNGITGLSSSPIGTAHTFVWDARAQLGNIVTTTVYVRLRANDGIANGAYTTSSVFTVDYVAPIVSNVSAVQTPGTTTVSISYDLTDFTASGLNVELGISNDSGSTWTIATTSATGNVGSGQTTGTGKTITWNAGADYSGQSLSTMRARVKARDNWQNQGTFTSSSNFSLDTLAPATLATANLQAQPNAGDTTVLIGGTFTEANPNTNDFYVAINNGVYSSATAGTGNTASPSNQATDVGATLDGNDFISKVKITHTDDFGNSGNNENTSPTTTYIYVKPYTPSAPTLNNPVTTRLDLTINPHASETSGLEYAIQETTSGFFVQTDGTLAASVVWQILGTSAGQWGNITAVSGKARVTGLSSPVANYVFKVKSRNTGDTAHATSSESAYSATAQITNTAPSVSLSSYSQTTDGTRYVPINYTGTDAQGDINSLNQRQYSTDNSAWNTMTEKSGVGSSGITNLTFLSGGSSYNFAWDSNTDLPSVEDTTVYVRLRSTDTLASSSLATSNAFEIDNVNPVISTTTASQDSGARTVTITYNLTDANASNVLLEISSNSGSTWVVATSSATGAVGSGVTAGAGKTITWNAGTDFNSQYNTTMMVRVTPRDTFGNLGSSASSANFTVDTKSPTVTNVTAVQDSGASTFVFHYDIVEDSGNSRVVLAISSNSGSTWVVPTSSVSGDYGASVTPGTGKTITWDGGADYSSQEKSTMQIRLTATDSFSNNSVNTSADFNLDTYAPRITNVSASQNAGNTTVAISYDLADANTSTILLQISSDNGSSWTVPTTTATGNLGSNISAGTGKSISWNAGTDFSAQDISNMKIRLRGTDTFSNQSGYVTSSAFALDTKSPVVATTANLQAQPNAGDTTALIGGSFTETNPNTNNFYVALDGGSYGSATAGTGNTASPSDQSTATGVTLKGNNYISKVKIVHTDDFGLATTNENTSPATSLKYVKPYTPSAPTADNPAVGEVDVLVNANPSEVTGLQYAIYETTQSKYVQANGTLGVTPIWQTIGTSFGQWGNTTAISGKIRVNGLANASYTYQFKTKSRNSSDFFNTASSESALSAGASSANQAPSISINSAAQTTNGTQYITVNYTGTDLESETVSLVRYQYSTDNSIWNTMTEKSGVGSQGTSGLAFSAAGASHNFAWDVGADLANTEDTTVYVRLQANDGTSSGNTAVSSAFVVDTKNPAISSVTASQNSGAGTVAISYTLTDDSTSTIVMEMSSSSGSTYNVSVSSATGNVGAGISSGSGKSISWNAGTDFSGQELSTMKTRLRATDAFGNVGSLSASGLFDLDTKVPAVSNVSAIQSAGGGSVSITYDLSDTNQSTVVLEVSSSSGSTWLVPVSSVTGAVGSGVSGGTGKTITWNANADFSGQEFAGMIARVRATDIYSNAGSNVQSGAFSLDTKAPVVLNVGASQTAGTTTVVISYDLSDLGTSTVDVEISSNNGLGWTVATSTLTGSVGSNITAGFGKTVVWNAKVDYSGQDSNSMRVRVRGRDRFNNIGDFTQSTDFNLDTLSPATLTTADLISQPNAGDTTASIGGSFTETHPNTNDFYIAINGGAYGSATAGTANTAAPSNQATGVGATLTGNDYISKVKIAHADDFGQATTNENTSPATSLKYVKPYTPSAPTVNNPQNTSVTVAVNSHASESASVEYAIAEVSTGNYIQTNGTLGASAVWKTLGTGAGKWGNVSGVTGTISVSGLTSPVANYSFKVKSRNPSDSLHASASESNFSTIVGISNTAPGISVSSVSQQTGNSYALINYVGTDTQNDTNNLNAFEFSTNTVNWFTMTQKSGVGSSGVSSLIFSSTGTNFIFAWDIATDLPGYESSAVRIRLKSNDGLTDSNLAQSSAFAVDAKAPVVSGISASQAPSTGIFTFEYTLADNSAASNTISLQISDDSGSTWTVPTTSASGDVGSGVSAGSARSITWNPATNYPNAESSNFRIRIRGTDIYSNVGSYATSSLFAVDTKGPVVSSVSAVQSTSTGKVTVSYSFSDITSAGNSTEFQVSSNNGSTWVVATTTRSGEIGSGQSTGSKTFIWDAPTDFNGQSNSQMMVRVRATDYFGNLGSFTNSSAFSLDTAAPVVSSLTGVQITNSTTVQFTYNLADTQSSASVIAQVSSDGGSTWTVPVTTLAGNIGSAVNTGSGLSITWLVGTDYGGQESNTMRVRLRATDSYGNVSAFFTSADFSINTLAPESVVSAPTVSGGVAMPVSVVAAVIDLIPPAAPLVFSPTAGSVIGEAEPTIIGGSEPGAVINIVLEGENKFIAEADANGAWRFILPSQFALQNGQHIFTLTAVDQAGNVSAPTQFTLTKSSSAPVSAVSPAGGTAGLPGLLSGVLPPTPSVALVRQNIEATEVASLQVPKISTTTPGVVGSDFVFSGTALPNQEVLVYFHSSQALIYRTRSDSNGFWQVAHAQSTAELTPGDHTIFAVSVDPVNKVKSRPSAVSSFTIRKNFWVSVFNVLNLQTTLVTLMVLGFTMLWLYRLRVRQGVEV